MKKTHFCFINKIIISAVIGTVAIVSLLCGFSKKDNGVIVASYADQVFAEMNDEDASVQNIIYLTIDDEGVPLAANN